MKKDQVYKAGDYKQMTNSEKIDFMYKVHCGEISIFEEGGYDFSDAGTDFFVVEDEFIAHPESLESEDILHILRIFNDGCFEITWQFHMATMVFKNCAYYGKSRICFYLEHLQEVPENGRFHGWHFPIQWLMGEETFSVLKEAVLEQTEQTKEILLQILDEIDVYETEKEELKNQGLPELELGDVVICLDRLKEQAKEFGHSEERECMYLFTHSMFHLLGYDHMTAKDKAVMRKKEEKIMSKINLPQTSDKDLMKMAKKAAENAFAPFSDYRVGAAILTKDGHVFTGCNVENSSYGATICAERTAAVKAVSEGFRDFEAIAVTAMPCGICRQFLHHSRTLFIYHFGRAFRHVFLYLRITCPGHIPQHLPYSSCYFFPLPAAARITKTFLWFH